MLVAEMEIGEVNNHHLPRQMIRSKKRQVHIPSISGAFLALVYGDGRGFLSQCAPPRRRRHLRRQSQRPQGA
jgi:hypothetical protein